MRCAHIHTIKLNSPNAAFEEINKKIKTRKVTIEFVGGGTYIAKELHISKDSTTMITSGSNYRLTVPTNKIRTYYYTNHLRGAFQGFLYTMIPGALAGALIGYTSGDDSEHSFLPFTAEEKAKIGAVFLGGVTGLFGLIIGGATGGDEIFIIKPIINSTLVETQNEF